MQNTREKWNGQDIEVSLSGYFQVIGLYKKDDVLNIMLGITSVQESMRS